MSRTSISVDEDTRDRCKEFKRESESWDEFINRAVDALAGDSDEFTDAEERIMNRLDDLETNVPEKTARELQTQLR